MYGQWNCRTIREALDETVNSHNGFSLNISSKCHPLTYLYRHRRNPGIQLQAICYPAVRGGRSQSEYKICHFLPTIHSRVTLSQTSCLPSNFLTALYENYYEVKLNSFVTVLTRMLLVRKMLHFMF
jgi:hypothetical protein